MHFDATISLGTILHLVVLVCSVLLAAVRLHRAFERRIDAFERRVDALHAEFDKRIGNGSDAPLGQRFALLEQKLDQVWTWWQSSLERRRS